MCICVCGCSEAKASDPMVLETQVVVSHLAWALGAKLGSSGRAAHALNGSLSPALNQRLLTKLNSAVLEKTESERLEGVRGNGMVTWVPGGLLEDPGAQVYRFPWTHGKADVCPVPQRQMSVLVVCTRQP